MKSKLFASFCLALALAGGIRSANAADSLAGPTAAEIVRQSLAKYAAMTSYSDEGVTISTLGKTIAASYNFTIKLARTNLYQVVWRLPDDLYIPKGVVWSAGKGDSLWMGTGFQIQKCRDRETAIASATGISAGAAANLPGTFFNMKWGSQLNNYRTNFIRTADDKVGDVDCFVLTHEQGGRTATLWISQQDFLIQQIENDTSSQVVRAMLEEQAKKNPQIRAMLDAGDSPISQDVKAVETHRNIVVNPSLKPADFDFQPPPAPKN